MTEIEPALDAPEVHVVEAPDGWRIQLLEYLPRTKPRAVVLLGHGALVDHRTLARADRDCVANHLLREGHAVVAADLRGHGGSGPRAETGGNWNYDAIVEDVAPMIELVRRRHPRIPLIVVGHSLFSHASLAFLARHPTTVSGVVALGCAIWNPRFEPSFRLGLGQRLLLAFVSVLVAVFGRVPAKLFGFSDHDESSAFWWQLRGFAVGNHFRAGDGFDYFAAFASIACPVLHVLSEGDRLARPQAAARFTAPLRNRELLVLGRDDAPGELAELRPDHMAMVTSPRSRAMWHYVAEWITALTR